MWPKYADILWLILYLYQVYMHHIMQLLPIIVSCNQWNHDWLVQQTWNNPTVIVNYCLKQACVYNCNHEHNWWSAQLQCSSINVFGLKVTPPVCLAMAGHWCMVGVSLCTIWPSHLFQPMLLCFVTVFQTTTELCGKAT